MRASLVQPPVKGKNSSLGKILLDSVLILVCFLLGIHLGKASDAICQSSSEYLDAMYRCRPGDFQVVDFCDSWAPLDLVCNESKRIVIYSASAAKGEDDICNRPETVNDFGSSSGNADCCFLDQLESRCLGRRKCSLDGDLLRSADARRICGRSSSRSNRQRTLRLTVIFTCVSQKTVKEIKRDTTSPDDFCEGHAETTPTKAIGEEEEEGGGVDRGRGKAGAEGRREASTADSLESPLDIFNFDDHHHKTLTIGHRIAPTTSSGLSKSNATVESQPEVNGEEATSDWLWSFMFIREHLDRFLVYLFLGVAVGVIFILTVVIFQLCCARRLRLRKRKQDSDEVIQQKQTTVHVSDATSPLIASNHTTGVEMVRYTPTDSLQAKPTTALSRNGRSYVAPSPAAGAVRFAGEGPYDSGHYDGPGSFSGNGTSSSSSSSRVQRMNVPQYQVNVSRDAVDSGSGDGRGPATSDMEDFRSNTLGRFYTNPYRHDSTRSDGYRTLQHK